MHDLRQFSLIEIELTFHRLYPERKKKRRQGAKNGERTMTSV
jgi:hypothetical protein